MTEPNRITEPGYYSLTMPEYLADPCLEPALSTTVVSDLVNTTPLHAKLHHPRYGNQRGESSPRGDLGSAVHALAMGGHDVVYCDADNWKTKAAQTFQDIARESNQLPLLARQRWGVEIAAGNVKLAQKGYGPGKCEQTMIFQIELPDGRKVWARCRTDFLDDAGTVDEDLKTVDSADGVQWIRHAVHASDLDVQAALRHLGHLALTGKPRQMRWRLQEIKAPYDFSTVDVTAELLTDGIRQVMHAAKIWRDCLDSGNFPGYSKTPLQANPATWKKWDLESRGVL